MSKFVSKAIILSSLLMGSTGIALAEEAHVAPVKAYVTENVMSWAKDPVVIDAIRKQNEEHAGLDQAKIDELDKEWRAQATAADKPLINEVLGREISKFLSAKKDESAGMITEVFVMDNKGLNVGQSDPTSDYWQGDEAKFQKSFGAGPDGVLIDEVEFDDSSESFISQVSRTITDGGGNPIGAVTIGINVENLGN